MKIKKNKKTKKKFPNNFNKTIDTKFGKHTAKGLASFPYAAIGVFLKDHGINRLYE